MSVTKVQTETTYEVEFKDKEYTVVHIEDANFQSGFASWEVFDDAGPIEEGIEFLEVVEYTIENMDSGGEMMIA
jgi:hypothetical protein